MVGTVRLIFYDHFNFRWVKKEAFKAFIIKRLKYNLCQQIPANPSKSFEHITSTYKKMPDLNQTKKLLFATKFKHS